MDLGQSRRGVDMGPSAVRYAGMTERLENLDYRIKDLGDIQIPHKQEEDPNEKLHNLRRVAAVNEELADVVDKEVSSGAFPLILGGDHSISIGSIAGIAKHYENLGVIWYDAHGD